jgi:hypothetical protein
MESSSRAAGQACLPGDCLSVVAAILARHTARGLGISSRERARRYHAAPAGDKLGRRMGRTAFRGGHQLHWVWIVGCILPADGKYNRYEKLTNGETWRMLRSRPPPTKSPIASTACHLRAGRRPRPTFNQFPIDDEPLRSRRGAGMFAGLGGGGPHRAASAAAVDRSGVESDECAR